MSRHLFGKRARDLTLAESGAHRRRHPRPLGAVALDQHRRRAAAQRRRAGRDARAGRHHARGRAGGPRSAAAHHRRGRTWPTRAPATRRSSCASSSATRWATTIRRTGRCTPRSLPAMQDAAEHAVAARPARLGEPGLQAALVAIDPETGDVLAMVGGARLHARRRSTARCAAGASPGRPSSRSSTRPRCEHGYSPVSRAARPALRDRARSEEWTPRNAGGERSGRADAARRRCWSRTTRPRWRCRSDRHGRRAGRWRAKPGCRDLPDVPSLALGTGARDAARPHGRLRVFPNGGYGGAAARHQRGPGRRGRPSPSRTPVRAPARHLRGDRPSRC